MCLFVGPAVGASRQVSAADPFISSDPVPEGGPGHMGPLTLLGGKNDKGPVPQGSVCQRRARRWIDRPKQNGLCDRRVA